MKWTEGQIDGVIVRRPQKHADERGWLMELFRSDELAEPDIPAMAYVSLTRPGISRGPHAHRGQTDLFGFVGPGNLEMRLWDNRADSPTYGTLQTIPAGADRPAIVIVPPGVVHGYRNVSDTDALVFNAPNRLFAGKGRREKVDEIRYEDSNDSGFVM